MPYLITNTNTNATMNNTRTEDHPVSSISEKDLLRLRSLELHTWQLKRYPEAIFFWLGPFRAGLDFRLESDAEKAEAELRFAGFDVRKGNYEVLLHSAKKL